MLLSKSFDERCFLLIVSDFSKLLIASWKFPFYNSIVPNSCSATAAGVINKQLKGINNFGLIFLNGYVIYYLVEILSHEFSNQYLRLFLLKVRLLQNHLHFCRLLLENKVMLKQLHLMDLRDFAQVTLRFLSESKCALSLGLFG